MTESCHQSPSLILSKLHLKAKEEGKGEQGREERAEQRKKLRKNVYIFLDFSKLHFSFGQKCKLNCKKNVYALNMDKLDNTGYSSLESLLKYQGGAVIL